MVLKSRWSGFFLHFPPFFRRKCTGQILSSSAQCCQSECRLLMTQLLPILSWEISQGMLPQTAEFCRLFLRHRQEKHWNAPLLPVLSTIRRRNFLPSKKVEKLGASENGMQTVHRQTVTVPVIPRIPEEFLIWADCSGSVPFTASPVDFLALCCGPFVQHPCLMIKIEVYWKSSKVNLQNKGN